VRTGRGNAPDTGADPSFYAAVVESLTLRVLRSPVAWTTALAALALVLVPPHWGGPGIAPAGTGSVVLGAAFAVCCVGLVLHSPSARSDERRAWYLIAAGLALYAGAGTWLGILVRNDSHLPVPYWTDGVWLLAYACLVAGVALVGRGGLPRPTLTVIVDGVLVGIAVMTIGAATAMDGLTRELGVGTLRSATALAYPFGDLVLLGMIAAAAFVRGHWRERRWFLLAVGALLLTVADIAYLQRAVDGEFPPGAWYHPLYLATWAAFAAAPWARAHPIGPPSVSFRWRLMAPGVVAAISSGILVWDHFEPRSVATIVLSALAFVAALARITLSFREVEQLSEARRLALTDDLTLLPNRRLLMQELNTAVRRADGFALLVLDVDRFKEINDTLGHDVGDRMLAEIGERLRMSLPAGDLVARLGGDEFAVLTASHSRPIDRANDAARRIHAAFAATIPLGGVSLPARASVGIALCPEHGVDAESLLKRADMAMYQAKTARSGSEVYAAERDGFTLERLALGADLHTAAMRGELRLAYQPIVDPRSGRLVRAEALLRWQHPVRGLLQPADFIAIAEQAGLMGIITPTVLRMATAQCEDWRRGGLDVGVAVNIAASDLLDSRFLGTVSDVLAESGIEPASLQLEITEHGVLTDPVHAAAVLEELRGLGVGISIDDYGTGNASLARLRGLRVGEIKIDRSFVAQIAASADDAAIVRSTIVLAHELGYAVVVEGVEDPEVLRLVNAWGADAVQGFLIGRPTEAQAIAAHGAQYLSALLEGAEPAAPA